MFFKHLDGCSIQIGVRVLEGIEYGSNTDPKHRQKVIFCYFIPFKCLTYQG